jgi:hypothetical protein
MLLYIAIIVYILSLITGLFLMVSVKAISTRAFVSIVAIHILLLLFFFFEKYSTTVSGHETPGSISFLLFICSGIILAGLSRSINIPLILKIYFSLFSITIALFLFSPSRLMVFLLSGNYSDSLGKTFSLQENYFIEQQNTSSSSQPVYKLVKKHGLFHETIQRDIEFKGKLDSIRLIQFISGQSTVVRGYSGKETFVSTEIDSLDVNLQLVKEKRNVIERKF